MRISAAMRSASERSASRCVGSPMAGESPTRPGAARTLRREVAPLRATATDRDHRPHDPFFLTDRDRLLLAFANLASYGIAARDAYGDSATEAHAAVAADLRLRHPHGLGAYVFWTRTDDARASTPTAT